VDQSTIEAALRIGAFPKLRLTLQHESCYLAKDSKLQNQRACPFHLRLSGFSG